MKYKVMVAVVSLVGLLFSGCATPTTEAALTVSDAWVRPVALMSEAQPTTAGEVTNAEHGGHNDMAMGGVTSAAYLTLRNGTPNADALVRASSDAAEVVELHNVEMVDSVMQMRPVEQIEVPAQGQSELKPGGYHIMLINVTRELKPGDTVDLTLTFRSGAELTVSAEVRQP
ncbi:copper chaperone PCu(A)C [Candidatus Gracilibacteria bacterium]|nr:copper chaperone PCu(A)C [Candidatus Gracilibacteria bacterium]